MFCCYCTLHWSPDKSLMSNATCVAFHTPLLEKMSSQKFLMIISKLRNVMALTGNARTLLRRRPLKKTLAPSSRTLTVMQCRTLLYTGPPAPDICRRAFITSMGVAHAHVTTPATPPAINTANVPTGHIITAYLSQHHKSCTFIRSFNTWLFPFLTQHPAHELVRQEVKAETRHVP